MKKKLMSQIEKFVSEKRKSPGGWAPITDEDIDLLYEIVHGLVAEKCDTDEDGDLPVQIKLINRRKYEPMPFFAVPYSHKDPEGYVLKAMANITMATGKAPTMEYEIRQMAKNGWKR